MNLKSIFYRLSTVYGEIGILGIAKRLSNRVLGRLDDWTKRKIATDLAFDSAHNVETAGTDRVYGMRVVGGNVRHAKAHEATNPVDLIRALDECSLDLSRFTFIDLGSGKGRALLLAKNYPFKRIIGVEFAAELHNIALANIAMAGDERFELINDDAASFEFPDGPLLIYMFNPFGPVVARPVAIKLMKCWREAPRPIRIIYLNPTCLSEWIDAGWTVTRSDSPALLESPAKGNAQ